MAVVTIDAGTTVIKAVGYDEEGRETVVARRTTSVDRPHPGWAEQDMHSVWMAVVDVLAEVVRRLDGSTVDHLAITAQGDGAWLVDAGGEPTGPAILWNDGRAASVVDEWTRAGVVEAAFAINGCLTSSGLPNALLAWLRVHDRPRLERTATVLTCGSWLFCRLTGEIGVDESDASAPFLDVRTRRYSPELLRLYDLQWAEPVLPEVRGDDRRAAGLLAAAGELVGLPPGTPVVLAPYDIAATAIGVGAVRTGQACSILGTTLCTEVVTDTVDLGPAAGLTVAAGVPGRYLRAFPTLAGGEVLTWACRLLGVTDPTALIDLATASDVGARGLVFLPYLSPAGERAPFLAPHARGGMLGMSLEHGRADVARAVVEGLSLVVQDCLLASGARPRELRVSGGGAASTAWLQMIADVTGLPVSRSADTEVGARGAFVTAAVATRRAPDVESAVDRYVTIRDIVAPDPGRAAVYAELFGHFLTLRDTTAAGWPHLAALRSRLGPGTGGPAAAAAVATPARTGPPSPAGVPGPLSTAAGRR